MSKLNEMIKNLEKALNSLDEALSKKIELHEIKRDACIQRFEYTFELSWKSIQEVAKHRCLWCKKRY